MATDMTCTGARPPPPDDPRTRPGSPRRRGPGVAFLAVLAIALSAAGSLAYLAVRHPQQQTPLSEIRVSGIPPNIPTSLANLMQLSPVPVRPAPNFTLVDQAGRTLSLSTFKGRSVVLEFMDTHCVDICPIVSQEFIDAYHDLGNAASRVVFVAVNVNRYHLSVDDVAAYSTEHQLSTIPSWHFFTGSLNQLLDVWHTYGVEVVAPSPNADVIHTSIVYFIDPQGRERYVAAPMIDHTSSGSAFLPAGPLASWGHGIALAAISFL